MRFITPAVVQDIGLVAPGFFQDIGQNGHAIEGTLGVDEVGQRDDSFTLPTRIYY